MHVAGVASVVACTALGLLAGCADASLVRGGPTRANDRVEGSVRDGRSSSDQLYDSYGRLARERGGY